LANVTVECHSSYTDAGASASDNCDGTLTASIVTVNPVNANTPGLYTVTYNVVDAAGNAATQVTRSVTVSDTTAPVPTVASLPDVVGQCSASVTAPSALDTCAGSITATTSDPTSYSAPGDYTVHWTYSDGNGNTSTQTQMVRVHDTTPPVITLVGLANVTVECHSTYTDAGATASDNCDGTLSVVVSNPVNQDAPGVYTVRYNVSDAALNAAVEVTRTVHVVDTTAPVPTVASLPDVIAQCSVTLTAPTASDACAGVITGTTVDPTSYSAQGDFTVHWTYNDGNGNSSTQTQMVRVHDTIAPVISLAGSATVTVECHGTYVDAGATASDNCSGTLSVTVVNPVNVNVPATYTVTYNVSDAVGNAAIQVSRTVNVVDSVAPTVTAGTIAACYTTQAAAEAAALSATTVNDACDAAPVIVVSTVGSCNATITVRATDAAGNTASVDYTAHIASPPTFGTITATEAAANVKNCFTTTVQGTVNISVQASAACGLSGAPTIALVNGLNTEPAVFDGESPTGTFNYHWTVTASTPNGTWHATVSASDLCQTSTANFTLCMNSGQVSGQLRLDGFVGTGTVPPHARTVTFVATDAVGSGANVLKTWVLPLTNVSGDTFSYVLSDAPGGTAAVSAKTDWTLRSKLPVTLDVNGQASSVDFTGTARLRGGDFDGDNAVNFPDYLVLGDKFFTHDPLADITGDGDVDFDDYTALAENWLTGGDPQ
jgi:hypothetical protein